MITAYRENPRLGEVKEAELVFSHLIISRPKIDNKLRQIRRTLGTKLQPLSDPAGPLKRLNSGHTLYTGLANAPACPSLKIGGTRAGRFGVL